MYTNQLRKFSIQIKNHLQKSNTILDNLIGVISFKHTVLATEIADLDSNKVATSLIVFKTNVNWDYCIGEIIYEHQ